MAACPHLPSLCFVMYRKIFTAKNIPVDLIDQKAAVKYLNLNCFYQKAILYPLIRWHRIKEKFTGYRHEKNAFCQGFTNLRKAYAAGSKPKLPENVTVTRAFYDKVECVIFKPRQADVNRKTLFFYGNFGKIFSF